eukprot:3163400-Lingulodinium_polyedra.AAC.1
MAPSSFGGCGRVLETQPARRLQHHPPKCSLRRLTGMRPPTGRSTTAGSRSGGSSALPTPSTRFASRQPAA